MEWIRHMGLKKALFTMAFINLTLATLLSVLSFWICLKLNNELPSHMVEIRISDDNLAVTEKENKAPSRTAIAGEVFALLQIALPAAYYVIAMMSTASLFYRWKLKEPLEALARGASRIMENDLDFQVEARTEDELGELCTAFETMRRSLLENNRELWRQAEERKRLNAAFSHDLRNPVTVLKGSAKMARQCLERGIDGRNGGGQDTVVKDTAEANMAEKDMSRKNVTEKGMPEKSAAEYGLPDTQLLMENLTRIEEYTDRIQRYVEIMSSVAGLEEVKAERTPVEWSALAQELEDTTGFIVSGSGIQFTFERSGSGGTICLDKNMLFQIAENLVSNGLRFAKKQVMAKLCLSDGELSLEVADDGDGFPEKILKNGVKPFQKGAEGSGHFGMGLYICELLCRKHGGSLKLENIETGARVCAVLNLL